MARQGQFDFRHWKQFAKRWNASQVIFWSLKSKRKFCLKKKRVAFSDNFLKRPQQIPTNPIGSLWWTSSEL